MTFQTTETRDKGTRVITLPFKPNSAQDEFIHSGSPKTMFVASVAAGKTTALCMRAWMISYKYPGNKGMIARYTYDEIRDTIIPTWKKCVPRELMLNPDCLDRKDIGMQTLLVHSQDLERPSEILFRNLEDPHTYECTPGESPVLMADWTVKPIKDVRPGDVVIGFTNPGRHLVRSTVTAVFSKVSRVCRMTMESGDMVRCTADHRWLRPVWYRDRQPDPYAPARVYSGQGTIHASEGIHTTHLVKVVDPLPDPTPEQEREALWLGGVFDGEGTVGPAGRISITQSPDVHPDVCARIERALEVLGFRYVIDKPKKSPLAPNSSSNVYLIRGGRNEWRKFLLWCRPARAQEIARKLLTKRLVSPRDGYSGYERVLAIERGENETVHALTTATGNYVVWGYASSNSAELGWFALSQANDPKITRRMWDTLNERLRWPVPYHFAMAEANWGGNASKGGWIWDEFENTKQGHLVIADTMVNWDNLPDDYKTRLANLPKYRQLHSIYGTASGWDPLVDIRGIPVFPEFKFGFHTPEDGSVGDVRGLFTQDRPVIRGIDVPGPGACVWCQMDEKGRLLVGHELALDSAIGTAEFADIVQSDSAQFFPGSKYLDYVDPAALRVEQTSGKSNAHVLYEKGLRPRPAAVQIEKRLQCVKDWLTMAVRGEAGLLIDPGCHRLVGGMQGGYNFAQLGSESGRYSPMPGKNSFSHVCDALQYACHGVARLQYAHTREDDAPPMPQAWLGSLRRNFPQQPRGTRPELEVASSRSRRDIRVRFPRIDD